MKLTWIVTPADNGLLLRTFLSHRHVSKRLLSAIKFSGGKICVNDKIENVRYQVATNDVITVDTPIEQENDSIIPEIGPLKVLFEDDFILVVDKPAGIASITAQYHPTQTMANFIKGHYYEKGEKQAIHIVSRLDKDTSGIMLIAKNRFAHARLSELHQQGLVKRTYRAFAEGVIAESGAIIAPIGRKEGSIMIREVREDGKYAETHYNVRQNYGDWTDVNVELRTGRTHQIRVHFQHLGHTLMGDDMYKGSIARLQRQALHSEKLRLVHPFTGEEMCFVCALPNDMATVLAQSETNVSIR